MTGFTIDPTELAKLDEPIRPGGILYRLNDDGSYSTCCVYADELRDPERGPLLEKIFRELHEQGKLFIVRNRPWKHVTK